MNYQVILLDPPWPYKLRKADKTHRNEMLNHYQDMTLDDILGLPVPQYADPQGCSVWLWVTNNHMESGFKCFNSWGVTHKTIYTWVKTTNDYLKPRIGVGHWGRPTTEHLLLGTIGKLKSFSNTGTLGGTPNLFWAPRRQHSRKPEESYEVIEKLQPEALKLEFFSRTLKKGWDQVYSNEPTKFNKPT